MKIPAFRSFNSKILLFGEYAIILGEEGLAIPIKNFQGKLQLNESSESENINPFIQYLGSIHNIDLNQDLMEALSLDQLIFKSNIPIGYGVGSSGALTAAVYDAFVENKKEGLGELKEDLSSMEDFFHGSSSGIDPLISFTNKAVRISENRIESFNIKGIRDILSNFYLIDTGIPRKTGPFVEIFKRKLEDPEFDKKCKEELAIFNSLAIQALFSSDFEKVKTGMNNISLFQFNNFKEMIPELEAEVWEASLQNEDISIKLCGAGGGGFLLVYAEDYYYMLEWFGKYNKEIIKIEY